eukprot:scaffold798_cov142-Skeletonema_dohrnii-CCMP3373.AAC.11
MSLNVCVVVAAFSIGFESSNSKDFTSARCTKDVLNDPPLVNYFQSPAVLPLTTHFISKSRVVIIHMNYWKV